MKSNFVHVLDKIVYCFEIKKDVELEIKGIRCTKMNTEEKKHDM